MTFPHLLIIGGMKCGSTTLFRDLLTNPRVFFPLDKEPENLCSDEVLSAAGRARYASHFAAARPDQCCAEASTAYTKRPDFEGMAERALAICGPQLRIIYLIRDPLARTISHHYHEYARGNMPPSIDDAVHTYPALINYSRYAMQAEPWIDTFGPDRVRFVRFEHYVADRPAQCARICEFLGIEPRPDLVEADKVFNKSDGKAIIKGPWRLVAHNPLYRKVIRPMLPMRFKDRVKESMLPKAPDRPAPPRDDTAALIRQQVAADQTRLATLLETLSIEAPLP
jgi:hypothetical protein